MNFDMGSIATKIKKQFERTDPRLAQKVGVGTDLPKVTEGDCISMPGWWQEATKTKGLYFGRMTMIAGDSDSGKTSMAIVAMKSAIEQGCGVIYVETENKTTTEDLVAWGVDPSKVLLIKSSIAEEAFELLLAAWDELNVKYPTLKLLVIFDSLGNTVSLRDAEMDLIEDSVQPGQKGKINRLGINKMIVKRDEGNAAILIINYTYDNLGSPGKTNAGGKAINFFSSLTYQTSRKGWIEKQVNGKKVRMGAEVQWRLFKNHINKSDPGFKDFTLRITAEGITLVGEKDEKAEE
jgi:RecA/RadA recombinase